MTDSLGFSPDLFSVIHDVPVEEINENKNELLRKERERQKKEAWQANCERERIVKEKREIREAEKRAIEAALGPANRYVNAENILSVAYGIALSPLTPQAMAERYQDAIRWCQTKPYEEYHSYTETLMIYCRYTSNREAIVAFYNGYLRRITEE